MYSLNYHFLKRFLKFASGGDTFGEGGHLWRGGDAIEESFVSDRTKNLARGTLLESHALRASTVSLFKIGTLDRSF